MDLLYNRALNEVGQAGKFQIRFDIIYNFLFTILWNISYNSMILALVIMPYWCEIPQKTKNVSDITWKSKFIPISLNNSDASFNTNCQMYIDLDQNNETKACEAFVYNTTWYETTIPSVNNWVCDKEIYVANIFSYSKIGEAIGSILFGWFGDAYGRKFSYILSLILLVFGRTVSILFSNSYVIFTIGCITASFPSWTAVQSVTVISMEISAPERRSKIAILRTIGISLGMCIMPFLYWWLKMWHSFLIVTTLALLPFLLFSWKIIESPRWLWLEGKTIFFLKELNKIAKINNKKLDGRTKQDISTITSGNKIQNLGPVSLFSGWRLAKNTILQLYLWVSVSLCYMVLIMSSSEKTDGNPYLEFAWQSIAELPATFVGAWLADNLGRRYAGAISYFISAFMWMLLIFRGMGTFTWLHNWWIGSTLVFLNRLATTVSYYVIYLFNMELYPTALRQSGMSLGNVFSSGGSAIAPYLMYIGRRIDARLPGLILCLITVIGAFSSLLLPETLNTKLPETVHDAQEFCRKKINYQTVALKRASSAGDEDEINN